MARVKRPGPGYPIDVAKINVDLFDRPEVVGLCRQCNSRKKDRT